MPLQIKVFTLGQMQNNTIVLFDPVAKKGIIVDPSFQNQPVLDFVDNNNLVIELIICTHAHFDHFAGVPFLSETLKLRPLIAVGVNDLSLWQDGGGSKHFHFNMDLPVDPDRLLTQGEIVHLGDTAIEIREVPGHSRGSIILYISALSTAICGDTIFRESIGRTDLEDGNFEQLLTSIKTQIFTLPDDTVLIPGHGSATTVSHEKRFNPFFQDDYRETFSA